MVCALKWPTFRGALRSPANGAIAQCAALLAHLVGGGAAGDAVTDDGGSSSGDDGGDNGVDDG